MLSPMQQAFIHELLMMKVPCNTTAARRAGYKHPAQAGYRVANYPHIKKLIAARKAEILKEMKADQFTMMKSVVDCVRFDITSIFTEEWMLKPPSEWPEEARAAVHSVKATTKTYKDQNGKEVTEHNVAVISAEKTRSNDLMAKLTGAMVEKIEVEYAGVIRLPAKKPEGAPLDDLEAYEANKK